MLAYVKHVAVKIPDELEARLRSEAEHQGVTIFEIARRALEAYPGVGGVSRLSFVRAGASGRQDVSERIEEILAAEARR